MGLNPREKEHCRIMGITETEYEEIVATAHDSHYGNPTSDIYHLTYILSLRKAVERFNQQSEVASKRMIVLTYLLAALTVIQILLLVFR